MGFPIGRNWYNKFNGQRYVRRGKTCSCGKPKTECDGWHGPKQAAIVMMNGTLIDVDYTNHEHTALIRDIDVHDIAGLITLVPADGLWHGEYVDEVADAGWRRYCYLDGRKTKDGAAKRLLREKTKTEQAEQAILDDPVAHLERELKRCDWYSHYSDDYSVWAGGEAHMRKIRELTEQVDTEVARKLWAKHAPKDVTCPV